ncbi:hypothetical protein EC973_009398 [Apophysomyces ossiformis]|uniref:Uncharacterized protein n=1 Tax=Apophysomyces ossiformis TaxID=679940 RepID=A0A8H7ENH6_9FUNG|nr:hypothetical protein EC973_009398 [Apophysomyces ossiformis]
MLDSVISRVKEEIAIDGNDGATLDVVWSYFQRFTALKARELAPNIKNEPVIDERYKAYIWEYLKNDKDLKFSVKADKNETVNDINDDDDFVSSTEKAEKYQAISDIASLSYDQAVKRYGTRMRVIADEKLQEEQLFVGIPTKEKGITQAQLTKHLDLDPRSTGHYVKSLEAQGAM